MQLIKPVFSIFAEDFELMKAKLSADEIVEMLSALSELCFFGETEYKPKNKIQEYFWDKLKDKFFYDLSNYKASVENGKRGGRPRNKAIKNPEQNPEQNPANNLNKTQDITQDKTQDITQNEPTKNPLVTCILNPESGNTSLDKSSSVCARDAPKAGNKPEKQNFEAEKNKPKKKAFVPPTLPEDDSGMYDIEELIAKSEPKPKPKKKAFVPPTLPEVQEYVKERGLMIDPAAFFDYFTEGEWKDSEGKPVKNWKQKALTWDCSARTRRTLDAARHLLPKKSAVKSQTYSEEIPL